ncbi:MAG: ABC transporter ATP-binding protein [Chroococcidiopsidaceae cyanobacterium CP_BM_RX_35]|nr:ABC transporter ATP-binding protein [Chroococcidiopsidaceae cyanobacterium CP_BM_RX_35]
MLKINSVSKRFDNGFTALESIDLQVYPGEIISIVGTSGCGKSTLLRIISGLDFPTLGSVHIYDQPITAPHPEIGIIFQEPRLMPWLKVWENVQFGLHNQSKAERHQATQEALAKVGLTEFSQLLPRELSGGMAQRVAIARALVAKPSILLLDEPFSALDAFTRLKMQEHLLKIWEYDYPTMILVTHDIEEALVLSDRTIVMRGNPGYIHQELTLNLPRPRRRTDTSFQHWRELLLNELESSDPEISLTKV